MPKTLKEKIKTVLPRSAEVLRRDYVVKQSEKIADRINAAIKSKMVSVTEVTDKYKYDFIENLYSWAVDQIINEIRACFDDNWIITITTVDESPENTVKTDYRLIHFTVLLSTRLNRLFGPYRSAY